MHPAELYRSYDLQIERSFPWKKNFGILAYSVARYHLGVEELPEAAKAALIPVKLVVCGAEQVMVSGQKVITILYDEAS